MPFIKGGEYENRHGRYVVLALGQIKMIVQYLDGAKKGTIQELDVAKKGTIQELDVALQERIVRNFPVRQERERAREREEAQMLAWLNAWERGEDNSYYHPIQPGWDLPHLRPCWKCGTDLAPDFAQQMRVRMAPLPMRGLPMPGLFRRHTGPTA